MRETGFAGYAKTPGNRGAWMLRREVGDRTEFVMITHWDSIEAVKVFAGEDYETAVFYPEDDRFLVERDLTAAHYDVVARQRAAPRGGRRPSTRPRAVVLVEGTSDQVALQTLAERRGRDLAAEGVAIVPMGGAQSIGRFLNHFGPRGLDVELAGLCDSGEEREFRRALERAGIEWLGFHVCVVDLEDELIRAL